jgi:SNF2 family DNA or RNA helicase
LLERTGISWTQSESLERLKQRFISFQGIEEIPLPQQFHAELRPYQKQGYYWLHFLRHYEFAGILADDMGLGKTVQTLAYLAYEKEQNRLEQPSLVVAPTSLMVNWRMEAERFTPQLRVLILHGPSRKNFFKNLQDYDLILTTYPLLVRDKTHLAEQAFSNIFLDEAQNIKNPQAKSTQVVYRLQAVRRFCLTGTPIENHLGELWSLFHFLLPGFLGTDLHFKKFYRIPIEKEQNKERQSALARRVKPFLLRRTKNQVEMDLPLKTETLQYCELEKAQRDLYETIRVSMHQKVKDEIQTKGLARSHLMVLEALLRLRQVCCDPRLLKNSVYAKKIKQSAKLELLMELVLSLVEEDRRILLFSQFTSMLELIQEELEKHEIPYLLLTGDTKDRATPIRQFQEQDQLGKRIPLFLISLKAGGTGLNLTRADTVIHYDPWWNPAVENQASDRVHRIGQEKPVFIYKLLTQGTVEEKILELQAKKRHLAEGLFGDSTEKASPLTLEDINALFEPLR